MMIALAGGLSRVIVILLAIFAPFTGALAQERVDPSYINIAVATGGQVLRLSGEEMALHAEAIGRILADGPEDLLHFWDPEGGSPRKIGFPVDSTLRSLQLAATAGRLYSVTLTDPNGRAAENGAEGITLVRYKHGLIALVERPTPGLWTLAIDAEKDVIVTARGRTDLYLVGLNFVRLGGRPGHQGLFPIKGNPHSSAQPQPVSIVISGNPRDVVLQARDAQGRLIVEAQARPVGGDDFLAEIPVSAQPFRLYVQGVTPTGDAFVRSQGALITPRRPSGGG
ncbi:MAG: hypothetical protein ACPGO3_12935 [Magnetospiraceae bacterium]